MGIKYKLKGMYVSKDVYLRHIRKQREEAPSNEVMNLDDLRKKARVLNKELEAKGLKKIALNLGKAKLAEAVNEAEKLLKEQDNQEEK